MSGAIGVRVNGGQGRQLYLTSVSRFDLHVPKAKAAEIHDASQGAECERTTRSRGLQNREAEVEGIAGDRRERNVSAAADREPIPWRA